MILIAILSLLTSPAATQDSLPEVRAPSGRVALETSEVGLYDVAHLTGFESQALLLRDLAPSKEAADVQVTLAKLDRNAQLAEDVEQRTEGLVAAIETFMRPPLEGEDQRLEDLGDGRLVLVGTSSQQAWLREFLDGLAGHEGMILIETKIIELPLESLQHLGIEKTGITMTADAATRLVDRVDDLEANILIAPSVLVEPFQRAELMAAEQRAYIKDYELQVLEGATIADPVIDVVVDGVEIGLRAVPLGDGRLAVDLDLELSDLVEPIAEFETSLGVGGASVTIQLPEVHRVRASSTVYLRAADTAVLATVDPGGKREYLILFSARVVRGAQPGGEGGRGR